MVCEAEQAESKADFIHKMAIAQKEANEIDYWIELLFQAEYITGDIYKPLINELKEIQKIISSILLTSKGNLYGRHQK